MTSEKVKLGLYAMNAEELVSYSNNVVTQMTGNPNFPSPDPDLAYISAVADVLQITCMEALNGGKLQTVRKQIAFEELKKAMRLLGTYIELISKGDAGKIMSAGVQVHKKKEKVGILTSPLGLSTRVSDYSGTIELRWKRVEKNKGYTVYMCSGDPSLPDAVWTPIAMTTKSKCSITDLEPGTFYWFKVATLSAAGTSGFSDPARGLAA